jgi:hypothetical protein
VSKLPFLRKKAIGVLACAMLASQLVPAAAHADPIPVFACQILPVHDTPGLTVLGQRVLPSFRDIEVCAYNYFDVTIGIPKITNYPNCGNPCFTISVTVSQVRSTGPGYIYVVYKADGTQTFLVNPIPVPTGGTPGGGQEICLIGVGFTPPCPSPV